MSTAVQGLNGSRLFSAVTQPCTSLRLSIPFVSALTLPISSLGSEDSIAVLSSTGFIPSFQCASFCTSQLVTDDGTGSIFQEPDEELNTPAIFVHSTACSP